MLASTAVPAGIASGAPNAFADQRVSKLTADGWRVTAVKSQEKVHSVAPLNQSPWTREGFLSLRGAGHIAGSGGEPVTAGTVTAGFQVGCNIDVTSGLALGVTAGPTAQMAISWPPALIVGAQAMPNVATTLKPGTIADVPFGTKTLTGATGGLTVDGVHVKVDGCLGPVAVRAYVTVAISTPANDTTVNVYGKPHYL
ncbi:MspA family porin [Gordonia mangrovi]|nr:MspA family porin [Gordonia mangrovi]UVF80047.1 MspA family porin [Gordonia mangrovi]